MLNTTTTQRTLLSFARKISAVLDLMCATRFYFELPYILGSCVPAESQICSTLCRSNKSVPNNPRNRAPCGALVSTPQYMPSICDSSSYTPPKIWNTLKENLIIRIKYSMTLFFFWHLEETYTRRFVVNKSMEIVYYMIHTTSCQWKCLAI